MNNNKILIGGIFILLLVVLGFFIFNKNKTNTETNIENFSDIAFPDAKEVNQNTTEKNQPIEKKPELADDSNFAPVGSYETYSPEKISEKSKNSRVVLFFNATWCPTCRALDRNIKANLSLIPGDITILSVDYDTYKDLEKKYGVTYQHTLVQVDGEGNMIKKWSGSSSLAKLVQEVK